MDRRIDVQRYGERVASLDDVKATTLKKIRKKNKKKI